MAYALIHENNSIFTISENIEKLKIQYPPYGLYENNHAGKMITISQQDYDALQDESKVGTYDGTNLILKDNTAVIESKDIFDNNIEILIKRIDDCYEKYQNTIWGTDLSAYKTVLTNFDSSTVSFPYNGSVANYLKKQGHSVLAALQIR